MDAKCRAATSCRDRFFIDTLTEENFYTVNTNQRVKDQYKMESPLAITIGNRMSAYLSTSEDYHKYRKRLNRELLRLRHELDLVTRDTKNYKEKEKISKISADNYSQNGKYGLLLLLTAERDLLFSLEIKSLLEISNESVSSYKTLMISKLKKCVNGTKKLLSIMDNESDDILALEVYIYAALNEGSLAINKRRWENALNAFSVAKCGLEFLNHHHNQEKQAEDDNNEDEDFNKTFINELIETLIDPSLNLSISQIDNFQLSNSSDLKTISRKYCHAKSVPYLQKAIEIIKTHDPKFVSEISSSIQLIDSITWRDHRAHLYNDEIAYKIMELTKPEINQYQELEKFDGLITGWNEVLELHETDLNKNQDEDDQEKIQDRAILLTFINYNLLFTKIRRDLILVALLTKDFEKALKYSKLVVNKDVTRVYLSITGTLNQIKELPGVYNDDDLMQSLDNMMTFYNAKRLVRLSNSFLLNEDFLAGLKVLKTVSDQLDKDEFYSVSDFPYSITDNQEFNDFKQELTQLLYKTQVLAQYASAELNTDGYVVENMHKFPTSKKLMNVGDSCKLNAMVSKPVLFDIGFNYINYTASGSSGTPEPTAPPTSGETEDKKKSGFFGIFGGRS